MSTVCYDKNFIDISLYNQWDAKKVKSKGLSKKLDENHPFFRDLYRAYADYLYSSAAIMNKKIEFYSSITFTVLKSDQEPIRLKIRVGDIVELNEESEGIAYAKVNSIIRHQANNSQYYAFFLFDWFQATDYIDTVSECLLYDIQKPEELQWYRIFPINFIDHMSYVHFVHNCINTCSNIGHDETNRSYILNEFYYKAI